MFNFFGISAEAQTWITVTLNGLPWKQIVIIVIFEAALKYCILDSFVDYEGYSIYSKEFLPTVVDIMVIRIKFNHSHAFQFTDSQDVNDQSSHFLLDHIQFTLIHGPNIQGVYTICALQHQT